MQLNEPKIRKAEFLPAEEAGDLTYPMLKKKNSNGLLMGAPNEFSHPTSSQSSELCRKTYSHVSPSSPLFTAKKGALVSHCGTRQVQMHWLPIAERGKYKAACMYFKCNN